MFSEGETKTVNQNKKEIQKYRKRRQTEKNSQKRIEETLQGDTQLSPLFIHALNGLLIHTLNCLRF